MKTRIGFVSNSSSSSFVIMKSSLFNYPYCSFGDIKVEDRERFENIIKDWQDKKIIEERFVPLYTKTEADNLIKKIFDVNEDFSASWRIEEYKGFLLFSTTQDNFDMKEYLENLVGREIHLIMDIPPYCGFDHWKNSINTMKSMIDIGFSEGAK